MKVEDTIIDIIKNKTKTRNKNITAESHLFNDMGLDSLDAVEIIIEIEDSFNIDLQDKESEEVQTVKDLIEIVESKIK